MFHLDLSCSVLWGEHKDSFSSMVLPLAWTYTLAQPSNKKFLLSKYFLSVIIEVWCSLFKYLSQIQENMSWDWVQNHVIKPPRAGIGDNSTETHDCQLEREGLWGSCEQAWGRFWVTALQCTKPQMEQGPSVTYASLPVRVMTPDHSSHLRMFLSQTDTRPAKLCMSSWKTAKRECEDSMTTRTLSQKKQ